MANRRLQLEIERLHESPSQYYSLSVDPNNILNWSANIHCLPIKGLKKTYDIEIEIICPHNYPFYPPSVKFLKPVKHACINKIGILSPDLLGGEWSPAFTLSSLMLVIVSLLTDNKQTF